MRFYFEIFFIFLIGFVLAGCGISDQSSKNFYIKVDVEATYGGKPVSGSAVLMQPMIGSSQGFTRGEAISIDLGNGKSAYMLLVDRQNLTRIYAGAIVRSFEPIYNPENSRMKTEKREELLFKIPVGTRAEWKYKKTGFNPGGEYSGYPLLVAFEDKNDPTSVFLVETEKSTRLFNKTFKLNKIYVERVAASNPLTEVIENELPWVNPRHPHWDGAVWITLDHTSTPGESVPRSEMPFAQKINRNMFKS